MGQLLTFRTCKTKDEAADVAALLEAQDIAVLIEEGKHLLDSNFTGIQYDDPILLKIDSEDFEQAGKILADNTEVDISTVDKDYMLFAMNNDELLDVIGKPDEWGYYNSKLAGLILAERGAYIDDAKVKRLQQEHYHELAEPKAFDQSWIILGYIISVVGVVAALWHFFMTILSLFGLILGWAIMTAKITLPDGKRLMKYDDRSRMHGRNMFRLGLLTCIIGFVLLLRIVFIKVN